MNIERLTRLREIIAAIPDDKLRLNSWTTDCGTIACALGWASRDPAFNAQGLVMRDRAPYYNDHTDFGAGEAFFGLNSEQSIALFGVTSFDADDTPDHKTLFLRRLDNLTSTPA